MHPSKVLYSEWCFIYSESCTIITMINFRTFLSSLKETPNSRIPPYVCPGVQHLETQKKKKKIFFIWILIVYIFKKVKFRKHKFKALCRFPWHMEKTGTNKQTTWQRKRPLSSEHSACAQGTRSGVWVQSLLPPGLSSEEVVPCLSTDLTSAKSLVLLLMTGHSLIVY